ncbi:MAG: D-alanyl-D-alanine carboxypeptidase family protein [Bacillota bacterium]
MATPGKAILACLLAAVIACLAPTRPSLADGPSGSTGPAITAVSAVLIDASTGVAIWEKDCDRRMAPASITKVLTAAVVLDSLSPEEIVTVSKAASSVPGSSVYLVENERVCVRDLLYGLILNSGNDAAVALAERISGSVGEFCHLMNETAARIGSLNSSFENPHGLDSDNHYTTARDMALIAKYAMSKPLFREVAGTTTYAWEGRAWSTTLINHNRLLWQYDGCTGVKTGFTSGAGHTLIASAARDGRELIAVLLDGDAAATLRREACLLFDYGFDNCLADLNDPGEIVDTAPLPFGKKVDLIAAQPFLTFLPEGAAGDVTRSVTVSPEYLAGKEIGRGETVGRLTYSFDGTPLGGVDLISGEDVTYTTMQRLEFIARDPRSHPPMICAILAGVAAVAAWRLRGRNAGRRRRPFGRRRRRASRTETWRRTY